MILAVNGTWLQLEVKAHLVEEQKKSRPLWSSTVMLNGTGKNKRNKLEINRK